MSKCLPNHYKYLVASFALLFVMAFPGHAQECTNQGDLDTRYCDNDGDLSPLVVVIFREIRVAPEAAPARALPRIMRSDASLWK